MKLFLKLILNTGPEDPFQGKIMPSFCHEPSNIILCPQNKTQSPYSGWQTSTSGISKL